jgi:hypothetical protein
MKRRGFLFEEIASTENLLSAARLAMRGKRDRVGVGKFFFGLEHEILQLQRELISGEYRRKSSKLPTLTGSAERGRRLLACRWWANSSREHSR